uniref:Uncharacterized protein n=1 Tax=Cucumis melo TaxID=3656 RepID=A0A9I9CTJ3_CUCME
MEKKRSGDFERRPEKPYRNCEEESGGETEMANERRRERMKEGEMEMEMEKEKRERVWSIDYGKGRMKRNRDKYTKKEMKQSAW